MKVSTRSSERPVDSIVLFQHQNDNYENDGVRKLKVEVVEIRNFTWIRQKILWYNLKIPAPAINDTLSTSRR